MGKKEKVNLIYAVSIEFGEGERHLEVFKKSPLEAKEDAEMYYAKCILSGLGASLMFANVPKKMMGGLIQLSFGGKGATAEEARLIRLATGSEFKAQNWEIRCSKLIDRYADKVKKDLSVGKYAPSLKNVMKEAVFMDIDKIPA